MRNFGPRASNNERCIAVFNLNQIVCSAADYVAPETLSEPASQHSANGYPTIFDDIDSVSSFSDHDTGNSQ